MFTSKRKYGIKRMCRGRRGRGKLTSLSLCERRKACSFPLCLLPILPRVRGGREFREIEYSVCVFTVSQWDSLGRTKYWRARIQVTDSACEMFDHEK